MTAPFLGTAAAKPALASSLSSDAEGSSDAAAVLLTGRDQQLPLQFSSLNPESSRPRALSLISSYFPPYEKGVVMKLKPNQTRTYDGEGFKKRAACLCFKNEREEEVSEQHRFTSLRSGH